MAFDVQNLVSGGLLKLNNPIDATTVNPKVQLYPVDALKVQVDNDPANDVLLTELVTAISAKKINKSTFKLDSESMWLTGGVEKTVKGRDVVEFDATVRGLFNATANNSPTAVDGGDRNYKSHQPQATCAIPEDYLLRWLDSVFSNTTNIFNRPLEASQGVVTAGVAMKQNGGGEFEVGIDGANLFISTTSGTAPANVDGAKYFATGFTPPGNPGDDMFADDTTGVIGTVGGTGKTKVGVHAINSDSTAGISIVPEAEPVELTQV